MRTENKLKRFKMIRLLKIIFVFLILLELTTTGENALAVSKSGTAAAQFLKIGIGARASALAGSFAALANDASALYWNPAGISWTQKSQFLATHTKWFAGLNHEFLGVSVPLSSASVIGLSFTALNSPEMEQTTISEPEGTGIFFDVRDIAIGLTYSRRMTDRFSFGITGKYIQQTLFNENAKTLAVDIGGMLRTGFKGMRLGIAMSNFGGKLQLDGRDLIVSYDNDPLQTGNPLTPARLETQGWPLPASFRLGFAMDIIGLREGVFLRESQRLTFAVDGYNVNDAEETVSFGLEYAWNDYFFLRGGYRLNHDTESFSSGMGVQIPLQRWKIKADYALSNMGDLGYIHRFGVGILF